MSGVESKPHSRDYLERTIETVRIHRDAENSWPQWANIFADEIERLWGIEEQLEAYRSALETLVNATMWESEDDARSVRQIARKALASNPAKEPS